MGIQNRNSKNKHGKNSVNVNINITESTPPKVVRVPAECKRRATAKAKRKASKVVSPLGVSASETDALSARPVEEFQELANEFSRVKDVAQSRGVPIPASYS